MSKKAVPRPSYRSPSNRYVLWGDIIRRSKQIPHVWWLVFSDVPAATVKAIRYRQHPDLRREDGRLDAELRNTHTDADNHTRGDLAVRWIPKEENDATNEDDGDPVAEAGEPGREGERP